ncbi:MAG TPA: polyhydroxyalkanoate depolymerase [Methylibium sp.]
MLYQAFQAYTDLLTPAQMAARACAALMDDPRFGLHGTPDVRRLSAACEVFSRLRMTHHRPSFGIDSVAVDGHDISVEIRTVCGTPFGSLLHFSKAGGRGQGQSKVLVVAPLSGHFATLLRDTVATMLPEHDIYLTDWHNIRHVPLIEGRFGLDDYVEHVMRFLAELGEGAHMVAVCQPCVPVLAAVALMAEEDHPAQPLSLTLMAGPVDARINPTTVNELATSRPLDWFERHLINYVPLRYAGALRRVYPGFLQLAAFMSMNMERHAKAFVELFEHLRLGDSDKADTTLRFYDEYFAVNDLSAEFYLETVRLVFQEHALAKGELQYRGRHVDPKAIRRTALLTVEGERDDICAIGQTVAAHDLCTSLRPYMKSHHLQPGVGHYGVFSGRRWQQQIYPRVRELIQVSL